MKTEFTKEFFQEAWGPDGYYENFSYGVGIDAVCRTCLFPFLNISYRVLEIGPGGGVFTSKIIDRVAHLTAIDVIKKPPQFEQLRRFRYIELPDKSYDCPGVPDDSIDFCFCYNTFCHLSDEALTTYLKNVHRVLKKGSSFVFMLSDFQQARKHFPDTAHQYRRGDMLPIGHFYQDYRTINLIADFWQWEVVDRDMIPDHRDIIIHLKKLSVPIKK